MHSFKCYWDNEKDWLVIKLPDGQEKCYTKEMLEDATAMAFVNHALMPVNKQYHDKVELYKAQYMNEPAPHKPSWEELLLPGIRQHWHQLTGGHAETCTYYHETQTYNIVFSQGMCAKLPRELFQDQQYVYIQEIIQALAEILKKYEGSLGAFDYKASNGIIYTIELSWQIKGGQAAKPPKQSSNDMLKLMQAYGLTEEMAKMIMPSDPPPIKAKHVKELHVYDLGDGMLVPCELAHEIVQWMKLGKKKPSSGWWMSKEMIEDDMYGSTPGAVAAIAKKVDADILKHQLEMYPGEIFLIDDMADAMHYLVDPNAFSIDIESENFDFIATKHTQKSLMHAMLYGQPLKLEPPTTVTIPKKPKQITKATLEHFHKLLGGKKDSFPK